MIILCTEFNMSSVGALDLLDSILKRRPCAFISAFETTVVLSGGELRTQDDRLDG